MTLIELFIIACIIVFITDLTDFPSSVKKAISYITTKGRIVKDEYRLHLIDCSLCQIFWTGLIYLLCIGEFNIFYIGFVCLLSCFSNVIKNYILLIEGILTKISKTIEDFLGL